MKITSFNPSIVTNDAETIMKLFQELGFERKHSKSEVSEEEVTINRMKNADGFCLDVVQNHNVERDMAAIRINVDDFEEAFALLTARGFRNIHSDLTETGSSKSAILASPSGFLIALIQHIRKENT